MPVAQVSGRPPPHVPLRTTHAVRVAHTWETRGADAALCPCMLPHPAPYTCHSNNTSITSVVTPASRNSITPRQPAPAHTELSLYSQVICPCVLHDSTPVPVHLNHQAMRSLYCTAADNFRYHRNAWMSATNPQVMQRSLESKTCNQVFNAIDGSWSTLLGVTLLQQAVAPNRHRHAAAHPPGVPPQ